MYTVKTKVTFIVVIGCEIKCNLKHENGLQNKFFTI